jgi:N6-adenosine-specific RNA methylase IME4
LLLNTHLEILTEDQCLVGIWITNKPSIRDLVVGENGIFDCWGIEFVEEWIWLKTTVHGEPVTPLDGIWRKPYEMLLLGRRRQKNKHRPDDRTPSLDIKRRVILGVPDLHSRKPCLKILIEPMMVKPTDYRALEVFARHLVAGWWSWGDECIKFNWDSYWRKDAEDEKP